MFGNAFGWPHLIVILVIVILLFGAPKLPGLARSIGQSMRIFRSEVKTMKDESAPVVDGEGSEESAAQESAAEKSAAQSSTAPETAAPKSTKPKP